VVDDSERLYATYFGDFRLRFGDRHVPLGHTRSVVEVCRYLIARAGQLVARDELLEILWPGADPRSTSHRLHVAISSLRGRLDGQKVEFDGQHYRFNPEGVSTDCQLFERHVQHGLQHFRRGIAAAAQSHLESALELYIGEYLEDNLYAEWTSAPRLRYAGLHLEALSCLSEQARLDANYASLLHFANRVIERDPLRERAHRQLMLAHYHLGQRAVAMRQYSDCADLVRRELGARPSRQTQLLYEAIRDDAELPAEPPLLLRAA
jgi:DNA-binding SARP family transcriptional activator